jgi:hypothetical protein
MNASASAFGFVYVQDWRAGPIIVSCHCLQLLELSILFARKMYCISHAIAQFIRAAKSGKTVELSALSQALGERGVDINECKDASHVCLAMMHVTLIDSMLRILLLL